MNFIEQSLIDFLKKKFSEHYKKNPVNSVPRLNEREIGYGEYGKKISSRHLSFSNEKEFNEFLINFTPFYVSASAAYYEFPSRKPMQAKNWNGADLIYEFDADDLKTKCSENHTFWECINCNKKGIGLKTHCDSCGQALKIEEWVCPQCLEETKKELMRLIDFLEIDLGLTQGHSFNFSGSKGFHMHLRSKETEKLSPRARVELVDYLTGNGLEFESLEFYFDKKFMHCPKESNAKGWQKIILNELKKLIHEEKFSILASFSGETVNQTKKILFNSSEAINEINNGFLPGIKGKKAKIFWENILNALKNEKKILLDRSTSIDSTKLIRIPNTLHGSTGLIAKSLSLNELMEFKGFDDAVVFSDKELKVRVKKTPKFYFNGTYWGAFKEETVILPEAVAIYLLLRGNAYGIEL
jgi:DNA primase small subunit